MERSNAPPLKTLALKSSPLTSHTIAWSCDAELAVATDDTLYLFLPEYPKKNDDGGTGVGEFAKDLGRHQFSLSFRASSIVRPDPAINAQLCAFAGVKLPSTKSGEDTNFKGVGVGHITGTGGATCQPVKLEWSPSGLGHNLRPILAVMHTTGSIVMLGEHVERKLSTSTSRVRGFKHWKILWGLGARLPIPDQSRGKGFRRMADRIKSFSWAKEIASGRALLAYMNDASQVVIMSVQFYPRRKSPQSEELVWEVQEVARFDGNGPHLNEDEVDPDFVPHDTSCALNWSPWTVTEHSRTATLAYIARNYVGFRRVTVSNGWGKGKKPHVEVDGHDSVSICTFLSPDAFVEWEDAVWIEDGVSICRGMIATPFVVKPFQVALTGPLSPILEEHFVRDCGTTYPLEEEPEVNPITGLVIHPPDTPNKLDAPLYSLVRLSVVPTNLRWYQTNLPEESALPQWVEDIGRQCARAVSRVEARFGVLSDSDSEPDSEDERVKDGAIQSTHPHRFRIWGLASSPGGSCTALLASKYSTQLPDRVGGVRVMFSWPRQAETNAARFEKECTTTEGRVWEWLYTQGDVNTDAAKNSSFHPQSQPASHFLFQEAIQKQHCVFCDTSLNSSYDEARCENGHVFGKKSQPTLVLPVLTNDVQLCAQRLDWRS
ncbi:hypothetical protein S40288_05430 [Stachybotrys chartarum IBT 40288]|nr:hypothetical protein S40288_05430 [Stachybotrys chartarum IBT 40288]